MKKSIVIIGAGPAGLTAGYVLAKDGISSIILEADPQYVGGISRTIERNGFFFDVGPHRFFSKSPEIERLWDEILPGEMLPQARLTRIFYRGKFFNYPLNPWEAFTKLGPRESLLCGLSFLRSKVTKQNPQRSFEDWVSSQFGKRLFNIFFRTYTEKVWGMPTNQISADWASQRIQGMSLFSALAKKLLGARKPKTLTDSFRYPRRGPGMLWRACADRIEKLGGEVRLGCRVSGLNYDDNKKSWLVEFRDAEGVTQSLRADHVISTAPIRDMVKSVTSGVAAEVTESASKLRYRDFINVNLMVKNRNLFSDHWIYIHDPNVRVARISNFGAWSPDMSPDPNINGYGLEYFCFDHDGLWAMSDEALVELGKREIVQIGLAAPEDIVDGFVVRQRQAYPVYDHGYRANIDRVREDWEARYPSFHFCGRNGMHRYNNQDHSMMTAWLAAKNIRFGRRMFDPWMVNDDAEYIEGSPTGAAANAVTGLRNVPNAIPAEVVGT